MMQPRLMILKRLGAVYGLMEEMHSLEARVAANEVSEVESVIRAEIGTLQSARVRQREAMYGEDLLGRSLIAVREEMAIQRNRQLEPALRKRRETFELAQLRYTDSRLWSERMNTLIEAELHRIAIEHERRMQAASDDRFLAQRRAKLGRVNSTAG
jgi:hypothetical protein